MTTPINHESIWGALDNLDNAGQEIGAADAEAKRLKLQAEQLRTTSSKTRDKLYYTTLDALLAHSDTLTDRAQLEAVLRLRQHKPSNVIGSEEFSMDVLMERFDALVPGQPVLGRGNTTTGNRVGSDALYGGILIDTPSVQIDECAGEATARVAFDIRHRDWGGDKDVDDSIAVHYSRLGGMVIGSTGIQAFLDSCRYTGTGQHPDDRSDGKYRLEAIRHVVRSIEPVKGSKRRKWDYSNVDHLIKILRYRRPRVDRRDIRSIMDTAHPEVTEIEAQNREDAWTASIQRQMRADEL